MRVMQKTLRGLLRVGGLALQNDFMLLAWRELGKCAYA